MASKKDQIPSHVRMKQFTHPGIDHPIIALLEEIPDHRKALSFFSPLAN